VKLPNRLVDEVDDWAKANGFDRSEAVRRLLLAGLGKATSSRPKAKKRTEADTWIKRAADRAQERSQLMGETPMNGTIGATMPGVDYFLDGRPVFEVEETPLGNFRFYCPWCKGWHLHGGGGGLGHRGAHCWRKNSPWGWSGYYLVRKEST
jgi:hypothetical protein